MSKRKKPERPPDWALELARNELRFEVGCEDTECCGPDDCGHCSRFVDVIAPALAAAYTRGREDATKENVGLLQRVDDLVRRVAAVESYRASSTAAAPHNATKTGLFP